MLRWISLVTAALALSACGGGDGYSSAPPPPETPPAPTPPPPPTPSGMGTLRVGLTDSPSCGFDKVFVTVSKVRVHASASAGEGDAGWYDINLASAQRIDLLTLNNGVLMNLGQTSLPAGHYQQLRLVLDGSASANAVVPTGGVETPLDTPAGLMSGLKINTDIDVASDQVADVAIDFDACKSVLHVGNSGRYQLKPVLRAITQVSDAGMRVTGYLDMGLADSKATVSLQLNGVPVRSTPTDANGRFVLYPVPAGTYDLVIRADGRAMAVMTGVPVTRSAITLLGSADARITPPGSDTQAQLSGKVDVGGVTMASGGETRLTQSLTGGPTIELGQGPVDAITGNYAYMVPLAMPVQLPYSAGATTFVFAGTGVDAGKVRITATVPALPSKSADLTLIGNAAVNFSFP